MSWSRDGRTRVDCTGPSPKMPPSIELLSIAVAEESAVSLLASRRTVGTQETPFLRVTETGKAHIASPRAPAFHRVDPKVSARGGTAIGPSSALSRARPRPRGRSPLRASVGWRACTGPPPKITPGERAAAPREPPAQRGRNHHMGIRLTLATHPARRQPNTMGDEQLTADRPDRGADRCLLPELRY